MGCGCILVYWPEEFNRSQKEYKSTRDKIFGQNIQPKYLAIDNSANCWWMHFSISGGGMSSKAKCINFYVKLLQKICKINQIRFWSKNFHRAVSKLFALLCCCCCCCYLRRRWQQQQQQQNDLLSSVVTAWLLVSRSTIRLLRSLFKVVMSCVRKSWHGSRPLLRAVYEVILIHSSKIW